MQRVHSHNLRVRFRSIPPTATNSSGASSARSYLRIPGVLPLSQDASCGWNFFFCRHRHGPVRAPAVQSFGELHGDRGGTRRQPLPLHGYALDFLAFACGVHLDYIDSRSLVYLFAVFTRSIGIICEPHLLPRAQQLHVPRDGTLPSFACFGALRTAPRRPQALEELPMPPIMLSAFRLPTACGFAAAANCKCEHELWRSEQVVCPARPVDVERPNVASSDMGKGTGPLPPVEIRCFGRERETVQKAPPLTKLALLDSSLT